LKELEAAVERLESGELLLEDALACFEEGVHAAADCQKLLQDAELKVAQLVADKDGTIRQQPFAEENGSE